MNNNICEYLIVETTQDCCDHQPSTLNDNASDQEVNNQKILFENNENSSSTQFMTDDNDSMETFNEDEQISKKRCIDGE